MKAATAFDWAAWQDAIDAKSGVFNPLREYLSGFFASADAPPDAGYARRPAIGLRLCLDAGRTLAVRPGWRPAARRRTSGGWEVTRPGVVDATTVGLELLGPSRLLTLTLTPGGPRPGRVLRSADRNREHLQLIADAGHAILTDAMSAFAAGQADHCCSCGRHLTDAVSRTRGIGPECIKRFGYFLAPPMTVVEQYRLDYYRDTGFLPGR